MFLTKLCLIFVTEQVIKSVSQIESIISLGSTQRGKLILNWTYVLSFLWRCNGISEMDFEKLFWPKNAFLGQLFFPFLVIWSSSSWAFGKNNFLVLLIRSTVLAWYFHPDWYSYFVKKLYYWFWMFFSMFKCVIVHFLLSKLTNVCMLLNCFYTDCISNVKTNRQIKRNIFYFIRHRMKENIVKLDI